MSIPKEGISCDVELGSSAQILWRSNAFFKGSRVEREENMALNRSHLSSYDASLV